MCAELLPEIVTLDDWGYPIVRPGPIPTRLLGHARSAVEVCPVLAIRLRQAAAAGRQADAPTAIALTHPCRGSSEADAHPPRNYFATTVTSVAGPRLNVRADAPGAGVAPADPPPAPPCPAAWFSSTRTVEPTATSVDVAAACVW